MSSSDDGATIINKNLVNRVTNGNFVKSKYEIYDKFPEEYVNNSGLKIQEKSPFSQKRLSLRCSNDYSRNECPQSSTEMSSQESTEESLSNDECEWRTNSNHSFYSDTENLLQEQNLQGIENIEIPFVDSDSDDLDHLNYNDEINDNNDNSFHDNEGNYLPRQIITEVLIKNHSKMTHTGLFFDSVKYDLFLETVSSAYISNHI